MQKKLRNKLRQPPPASLRDQLEAAIREIEGKISDLEAEKAALKRQLEKVLREKLEIKEVVRANSISRIIIEKAILDYLANSMTDLKTYSLYIEARMSDRNLKISTLRSYLFRMKQKGLIRSVGRGVWRSK